MINWFGALDFKFKIILAFGKLFLINEVVQLNIVFIYFRVKYVFGPSSLSEIWV